LRASTQYKFVYLANPKCASTSLRKALQPYSDIRSKPFAGDHSRPRGGPDPAERPDVIYNHSTAAQVRHVFQQKGLDWSEFFVFTTLRNPWARVWSTYNYGLATPKSVWHEPARTAASFLDFIRSDVLRRHSRTIDVMTQDESGTCLVDMIIKVEELDSRMAELSRRLGFELSVKHLNRVDTDDYASGYDGESRRAVADLFEADIEIGKYQF